jgi:serine/threonine-protein kinase RsbW
MIFHFEHDFTAGDRDFAELDGAIADCLETQPVSPAAAAQVMIAFDELISNILNNRQNPSGEHGDNDAVEPKLTVKIEVEHGKVSAEIADNGPAFDPLSLPEPDTDLSAEEREIGGLGVHLVRNLMTDVTYARENGWNRLRFSKTFELG